IRKGAKVSSGIAWYQWCPFAWKWGFSSWLSPFPRVSFCTVFHCRLEM
ncbi:hypothetical protein F444_18172, partial [Phytophthora nicotianae P1976]